VLGPSCSTFCGGCCGCGCCGGGGAYSGVNVSVPSPRCCPAAPCAACSPAVGRPSTAVGRPSAAGGGGPPSSSLSLSQRSMAPLGNVGARRIVRACVPSISRPARAAPRPFRARGRRATRAHPVRGNAINILYFRFYGSSKEERKFRGGEGPDRILFLRQSAPFCCASLGARMLKERKNFTTKLPRTTLGTGLARTGTNTGTPREPPKRLPRGRRGT
jgi:hypothetical protein